MSWTEGLDSSGWDLDAPGTEAYARGAIISAGVSADASNYAIMGALRDQGLGFRSQQMTETINDVRDQVARSAAARAFPIDISTGVALGAPPAEGWEGDISHLVVATYRLPNETGGYDLVSRYMTVTSREAMSAEEAGAAATDMIAQADSPTLEGSTGPVANLLATTLAGAWYNVSPSPLAGLG